jgi:hypothetical protein
VKRLLRILAGSVAFVTASIGLTACDTSPYAAVVNSQVIKEAALDTELHYWAADRQYVSAYDSAGESSQAASQGECVTVVGAARGTYCSIWVSDILQQMIEAAAIHQHLVATGGLPGRALLAAARAVREISVGGWDAFPASFRQTLTARLADQAALSAPDVAAATLLQVYDQYKPYFFTRICVAQSNAATQAAAESIAASGADNGARVCYDQVQLEGQPPAFATAVMDTAAGETSAPVRLGAGYVVLRVVSRVDQPYSQAVRQVLSAAIDLARGSSEPAVTRLLDAAHVQVNLAYGTWQAGQLIPPQTPQPPSA